MFISLLSIAVGLFSIYTAVVCTAWDWDAMLYMLMFFDLGICQSDLLIDDYIYSLLFHQYRDII